MLPRPVRFSDLPLIVAAPVLKTKSSPSSTNQTGTTCGRPSRRVVASLAVRVPVETNSLHSVSVIAGIDGSYPRAQAPALAETPACAHARACGSAGWPGVDGFVAVHVLAIERRHGP